MTETNFDSILATGSILINASRKKRFAVESESFEGTRDEEIIAHPERYPIFHVDFSGYQVKELAEWSMFHTAIIDKARKEFRKKDPSQAEEWRGQWEEENGHPIVTMAAKDMAGMKLPESAAEVAAKVMKMADKMDPTIVADLIKVLQEKQKG